MVQMMTNKHEANCVTIKFVVHARNELVQNLWLSGKGWVRKYGCEGIVLGPFVFYVRDSEGGVLFIHAHPDVCDIATRIDDLVEIIANLRKVGFGLR